MGNQLYPQASELLVTADAGGSNSSRSRLWKVALQELADDLRLRVSVCHFPPGTSKWNKIEHRLFCHITLNWRGHPLVSRTVIVNLIGNTKTRAGLQVRAELERYLVALSQREAEAWREVDALIATKQPGKYDDAVKLLKDLRDIAIRAGRQGEVEAHLVRLREQHTKKPSLLHACKRRD